MPSPAAFLSLDHKCHSAYTGHELIALREVSLVDGTSRIELRKQESFPHYPLFEGGILFWETLIDWCAHNGNCLSLLIESGLMSDCVDPRCKAAHDTQTFFNQCCSKAPGSRHSFLRDLAGSNDGHFRKIKQTEIPLVPNF